MRLMLTFLLAALTYISYSQKLEGVKPADLVKTFKSKEAFQTVDPFAIAPQKKNQVTELEGVTSDYMVLNLNKSRLNYLSKSAPKSLSLKIPNGSEDAIELELVQVDIFTSDFNVTLGSTGLPTKVEPGIHYRGIIKGDNKSVVAISVYKEEIMGLIANDHGNQVLGKLSGSNWNGEHILYNDREVLHEMELDCATPDDGKGYTKEELEFNGAAKDVGDCIRLYIEVDHDIHNQKGGVTAATNYVTGLLNQVITLYANENISSIVSEIKVWDVVSPYSSNDSGGMLDDFLANTADFNGDLAQLLSYQASGGIAYISGLCRSNPDYSKGFSSIGSSYANVPSYSWSVMVVTHEFGHLWGSKHTHACVWNGNNTAIDGCAGSTEGSCPNPGNPSSAVGGTIMSYCHLTSAGINLSNGFGTQPGNVIRNSVANANCTSSCAPPTCEDGIQNGEETGVDCGGPDCPDCPPCGDLTLTIVLDNYPEETSWTISAGPNFYASGGTYGSEPDGSTIIEMPCLPEGCYDFNIFDSYGDGMCCGYGDGSYLLEDASGNVLASGGSFSSSETTNFCITVGGGPDPTCDDGIQNGDETGVDCGGSCTACPTCDDGIQKRR